MSNSFGLYIKRAESFQNAEFISHIMEVQGVGIVKSVTLIPKVSANGAAYNGAIVLFSNTQVTPTVENLLQRMEESLDGTCRYNYDMVRYWIIKRHDIVEPVQQPVQTRDIEFQAMCQQEASAQVEECSRLTMENFLLLQENANLKKQLKEMEERLAKGY